MIYKLSFPEGTEFVPFVYQFLKPARLTIRRPDGLEVVIGFGIGELIAVMEPRIRHLITSHELLKEIPMVDGSTIVKYPDDLQVSFYG